MTKVALVLSLLAVPVIARAQPTVSPTDPPDGAIVASAQVSGFELGRLSPGLQEDIGRIAGGPLDRKSLSVLAERIEEEQPRYVAAVRVTSVDNNVRVVFVVAHMRDQDQRGDANARYLIERVEIRGIAEGRVAAALNNDVQTLVGTPLGSEEVDKVEAKIRSAFPDYGLSRRVTRGYRSGQIRLLFILEQRESARWLRFTPMKADMLYHSDQGWGAYMDFPIGGRDFRVTPIFAIDHGDELVEEYSGIGVRVESRKLGTERLGASFEWMTTFDQDWRDATFRALAANPTIPGAYNDRSTITPLVNFAITRQLSVGGGVAITELEPLADIGPSQMANAYIAQVRFDSQWEQGSGDHIVGAQFTVRAADHSLESDFDYNRYFGQIDYAYKRSRHTVIGSFLAGGIDGAAPLFERFTLGDSKTLRGWDKYDIAPAGGDRVFHTSIEYRYSGFAFFLDSGAVWDAGIDKRVRVAAGFGFHSDPFFMTVGFPLNTDDVRAVFTTGVRFGGITMRKY